MSFSGSFFGGVLEAVFVDDFLVDWDVDGVSGWHNVVVVNNLDEWLHLVSASDLLFAHRFGDFSWVSVNTSNQSMSIQSRVTKTLNKTLSASFHGISSGGKPT